MAREFAIAYRANGRPGNQPAAGAREVRSERHPVSRDRNIQRVNPTPAKEPSPMLPTACVALTRDGSPCKALPITGGEHCVFHRKTL